MKKERDLFLKEFTKELIKNSKKPEKKFLLPEHPVKKLFPLIREIEEPRAASLQLIPPQGLGPQLPPPQPAIQQLTPQLIQSLREYHPRITFPQPRITQQAPLQQAPLQRPVSSVNPSPQALPPGFNLGKLEPLIADDRVTNIECPGPGKYILVKIQGKINPTRITLSEGEIKNIIEIFSQYSKIPVMEGLFKTAIGNLVITAVMSDFVGSRFIINKYTPYSIIENQQNRKTI